MAPSLSKYLTKGSKIHIVTGIAAATSIYLLKKILTQRGGLNRKVCKKKTQEEIKYVISDKREPRIKGHINIQFLNNLIKLLKIAIPSCISMEIGLLLLICASLISRSLCDLWMISHITTVESAIIDMDKKLFIIQVMKYITAMPVIAAVNNILKYSVEELKIHLRKNITKHLLDMYLKKFTYYRIINLDNRIKNLDQLLTADIDKFCQITVDLFCNAVKPLLDIGIYVYKLNINLGYSIPALFLCYLTGCGFTLTNIRRPVAALTVTQQKLEGELRNINNRIASYSEEIAFYQGNCREKNTLFVSFNKLISHLRNLLHFETIVGFSDDIGRNFGLFIGFYAVSIPFLSKTHSICQENHSNRSRLYYYYGSMLLKVGQSIARLVIAGHDLTKLVGFTMHVSQLLKVFQDLDEDETQKTSLINMGKLIFKNNIIKFEKVPIITPTGEVLIKELSIEILSGMNVLICGPNGSGKSSIFRILGELWPLHGGELTKPPRGKLFYIPQKPYMTLGSLRDQIIYPHSNSEAKRRGCTDDKLKYLLNCVELDYLLERPGGLDAVEDWFDVLSGGEKQRIAMARLFYHAPEFAILDECTSAVSADVEYNMYQYCRTTGITLLTVSHRKSLWKHHEFALYLDGYGNYTFRPIKDCTEEFGS